MTRYQLQREKVDISALGRGQHIPIANIYVYTYHCFILYLFLCHNLLFMK